MHLHLLHPQNPPMRIRLFSWLFLMPMICLLSITGFCISAVSAQCLGDQQSLLLQLKSSLVFDSASSTKLVHWNQSVDCCSWEGVSCNEGRVIGLDLTKESISGGLDHSSSLFGLQYLQHLDLASNNFSSEIPSQFYKLMNLRYLNLSNACFKGQIPIAISHLTRLVTLDLSTHYFTREFYHSLKLESPNLKMLVQNLSELMELHLDCVNISAQGYEWGTALSSSLPKLRVLSLSDCLLSGPLDSSLTNLQSLSIIRLDNNYFDGPVPYSFANFKNLTSLSFRSCGLNGSFPEKIFQVPTLETLDLSDNFVGSIPSFNMGKNLTTIDLSNNNLSGQITSTRWEELLNLEVLDLSYNSLEGSIPISLFSLPSLSELGLHKNRFSGQLNELSNVSSCLLETLELSYNNLDGPIPMSLFSLSSLQELTLSNNRFSGPLNELLNVSSCLLETLDLSYNNLEGPIPMSLFEIQSLRSLSLSWNNFNGTIPNVFPSNCKLQTLNLNGNQLRGKLPKSLAQCTSLEVLNLGNNHIEDAFPCYLKNISMLHALVLRSNKFYGPIDCQGLNASLSELQIVDLAANNFTGKLPLKYFLDSKAMTDDIIGERVVGSYYTWSGNWGIPLSSRHDNCYHKRPRGKDSDLYIFTSLDFSCNNFDGSIPGEIGELKSLSILNLSHNAFTGQIPPSLGKLSRLESLDLSSNELTGEIPFQLADGLIFLSVLNLSFNLLVGKIPSINQFSTFSENSYEWNIGLCGYPLKEECPNEEPRSLPPTSEESHSNSRNAINWNFLSAEFGFIFGFGIVIGPLMFWKKWRICYYKHADDIFFKMFPQLYIIIENRRRRAHKNQGRRH